MEAIRKEFTEKKLEFTKKEHSIDDDMFKVKTIILRLNLPMYIANGVAYDTLEQAFGNDFTGGQITSKYKYFTMEGGVKLMNVKQAERVKLENELTQLRENWDIQLAEISNKILNIAKPIYVIYCQVTKNRHEYSPAKIGYYSSLEMALLNLPIDTKDYYERKHWIQIELNTDLKYVQKLDGAPTKLNYDSD
jgi:hypothetical protein